MKKILLIAFRDFNIRIRNKTFLLSTLLLPIGMIVFYGAIFFFSSNDNESYRIGINKSQIHRFINQVDNTKFTFLPIKSTDSIMLSSFGESNSLNAYIQIPDNSSDFIKGKFEVYTYAKLGIITKEKLENKLQKLVETERFANLNLNQSQIDSVNSDIHLHYTNLKGNDESEIRESIAYALSFAIGILMYVILTIYGAQVMRGVMEEKTNRIVEIIISSVKPFELLMGKIIGIGMVSFLQLCLWGVIILGINLLIGIFIGGEHISQLSTIQSQSITSHLAQNPELIEGIKNLQSINLLPIIGIFIFYFIGGYFLYSSLFASVGSAVGDDPQDVQALMFPIMIPIFLSFIFLTKSINNPNCTEAVIASMVPFTAPVVMMSRVVFGIPEGVPLWQLLTSIGLMIITTIFFVFVASRIYKIGILLYGKKVSWVEMIKWVIKN